MDGFLSQDRVRLLAAAAALLACAPVATAQDLSGTTQEVLVNPTVTSSMYAGSGTNTVATGVYKSTDWGLSWTLLRSTLNVPDDFVIDPQDPSTLYLSDDFKILKSTDGGATWVEADTGILPVQGVFFKDYITKIAVDPVDEGVVYAAGGNTGLYKSTDGGQNWTSIDGGVEAIPLEIVNVQKIIVDPVQPSTVYFAMDAVVVVHHGIPLTPVYPGLYKSTDGGATWNATGIHNSDISAVVMDPNDHLHLLACVGGTLMSSKDGGDHWTGEVGCGSVAGAAAIAIDPTDSQHVLIGSQSPASIYESFDGGATSSQVFAGAAVIDLAFDPVDPKNVYAGTAGSGLYSSRDGGATWLQAGLADVAPKTSDGDVVTKAGVAVSGMAPATASYASQTLGYGVVTPPGHGKVTLASGTGRFTYVPAKGFIGSDSFTFQVTDALGTASNVSTVNVTVDDVAPRAVGGGFQVLRMFPHRGNLNGVAAYAGQVLSYSLVSPPAHGRVNLDTATGAYTYTSARGFKGQDSLSFQVTDQWGLVSDAATVNITVR